MTDRDRALAELYVHVDELAELLRDVSDALPAYLEQQVQALRDGITGAETARRWIRAEGVRAVGSAAWLRLLEQANAGPSVAYELPAMPAAPGWPLLPVVDGRSVQVHPESVQNKVRDRRIEHLMFWLRREHESRARERSRLYEVIAQLHCALKEARCGQPRKSAEIDGGGGRESNPPGRDARPPWF